MRTILFLLFSTTLLFQAGCSKDHNRPADLPPLYPVKITVTQEGQPVEGATVTVNAKTPMKYGSSSTDTDTSGVATLRTYGYAGVPAGEYVVAIERRGIEGAREVMNEYGEPETRGGQIFQYVDAKFASQNSSPLSITVTDKGATETFEVGTPVRVFLGTMP